jgi:hypothetical protein
VTLPTLPTTLNSAGKTVLAPVRPVVQKILGTHAVKRVGTAGGAQVWARSKLSRRALLRRGTAAGVVVICPHGCGIRSTVALAGGKKPIPETRQMSTVTVRSLQAHVLSLTLSASERQALLRLRKPHAKFALRIRPKPSSLATLERSIPIVP